jgi:hypothetical protein
MHVLKMLAEIKGQRLSQTRHASLIPAFLPTNWSQILTHAYSVPKWSSLAKIA